MEVLAEGIGVRGPSRADFLGNRQAGGSRGRYTISRMDVFRAQSEKLKTCIE